MSIEYADEKLAAKRRNFDGPTAGYLVVWLAVLILPPIVYTPMVAGVYNTFKMELPGVTKFMLAFGSWNAEWGWVWLIVPIIAGLLEARLYPEPTDAIAIVQRRQERLYMALLMTLIALLLAMFQLSVLLAPWITILQSVSGGGKK